MIDEHYIPRVVDFGLAGSMRDCLSLLRSQTLRCSLLQISRERSLYTDYDLKEFKLQRIPQFKINFVVSPPLAQEMITGLLEVDPKKRMTVATASTT